MGLVWVFPLSDWAKNLTMRTFYRACRNAARKNLHFQLLTHHYIAPHTLRPVDVLSASSNGRKFRTIEGNGRNHDIFPLLEISWIQIVVTQEIKVKTLLLPSFGFRECFKIEVHHKSGKENDMRFALNT